MQGGNTTIPQNRARPWSLHTAPFSINPSYRTPQRKVKIRQALPWTPAGNWPCHLPFFHRRISTCPLHTIRTLSRWSARSDLQYEAKLIFASTFSSKIIPSTNVGEWEHSNPSLVGLDNFSAFLVGNSNQHGYYA